MTFRCSSPSARRLAVAACATALGLGGCGGAADEPPGPRQAAAAFLQRLAGDDAGELCGSLTARAAVELARDFGGSTCAATAAAALRYVATQPGLRAAIAATAILPNADVPLSPAPYRAGSVTTALRVVIHDPALDSRQALDLNLRRVAGRWRVDHGVNALMTIVRSPPQAPA